MAIINRLKNAWSAFNERSPTDSSVNAIEASPHYTEYPSLSTSYMDAYFYWYQKNDIIPCISNWIASDCSNVQLRHAKTDDEGKYVKTIYDSLTWIFEYSANKDQSGKMFVLDMVYKMLCNDVAVVVPSEVIQSDDKKKNDGFEMVEARVGTYVSESYDRIVVRLYNPFNKNYMEKEFDKDLCLVLENPFSAIFRSTKTIADRINSITKAIGEMNNKMMSDKFNLIFQLPYNAYNDRKRELVKQKAKDLNDQLSESPFGIGWIDNVDRVIQLNRPVTNDLWSQYVGLTDQLLDRIGFPKAILTNTADEQTLTNYQNRIICPILDIISEEATRKWLGRDVVYKDKEVITYFVQPFKNIPSTKVADTADSIIRNEVASINEFRSFIGMPPIADKTKDTPYNPNMKQPIEKQKIKEREE